MTYAQSIDGDCPKCGDSTLVWWEKDETESAVEVYMDCNACRHQFPKIVVSKEDDTSWDAHEERLKERYL